ncbi:MAG: hypothetical protein K2M78_15370 [Lachnospiraceae bacterium]|nr:hypothetical protein [Lachnospiraceae bacterium]
MKPAEIWNVIILFTQAAILIGQLLLSRKINQQTISKEKGYFLIENTNIPTIKGEEEIFRDKFNLNDGITIGFYCIKTDVILRSTSYSVNGVTYEIGQPVDVFFTEDNRFNKLEVLLDLKESDLKKDYLDIEFVFKLRNTVGYEYTETVRVRFSKMKDAPWHYIKKYNMSFDK